MHTTNAHTHKHGTTHAHLLSVLLPPPVAQLKADAATIEATEHLESQRLGRSAELDFLRKQNELEIAKAKELSGIEVCCYWQQGLF